MKKIFYVLAVGMVFFSGCSKDSESPKAAYEFSKYLIDEISVKDYAFDEDGSSYEIGWLFDSVDGGKVTELGGLFPQVGTYTVTLWDAATEEILAQTEVTASVGTLVMKKIDAVTIVADKDYIVTYNTYNGRDYYWLDPTNSIYPVELNGITVHGEVETVTSSTTSQFPGVDLSTAIVGVPEIGFIKN